jgi:hypothetical protein
VVGRPAIAGEKLRQAIHRTRVHYLFAKAARERFILFFRHMQNGSLRPTAELRDAGGAERPNPDLMSLARIRSSDFDTPIQALWFFW